MKDQERWWLRGACRGMDVAIFFPVSKHDVDTPMALMTCRGCPVRRQCLEYAVSIPSLDGIWAGTSDRDRERIRLHRRRLRLVGGP